jgi:hypothetical protein
MFPTKGGRAVKGSLSAWRLCFLRAMSRDAIGRKEKSFRKIQNQKHRNQKFEKRTNAKSKNKNFSGNFETGKTDRGSKEAAMFSIDLELSRSPAKPVTEMPETCETLDVPATSPR